MSVTAENNKTKVSKTKRLKKGTRIFCDIRKCLACKSCELACAIEHSISKRLQEVLKESKIPKKRRYVSESKGRYLSVGCQHCKDAVCVIACMSGALSKDEKTQATIHDPEKCVGCWMCIMVCPFGAISQQIEEKIAVKCDLCPDREDFACVAVCPTGALFAGTLEEFKEWLDEGSPKKKSK